MGGAHGSNFHIMKEGKDTDCKCSTFLRVCTGTDFIKQDQRIFVSFVKDFDNICHMRGKGTEALFNTLFIANICIDFCK